MKLLENWYQRQIQTGKLVFDAAQLAILQQLDSFIANFSHQGLFNRLFTRPTQLGFYLHGSVGRGKSLLLNEVYRHIPTRQKLRVHFHQFMHDIHQQLAKLNQHNEPLHIIAKQLKQKYKIIFLDEMHVSDIATAMILKSLFVALFANRIYIITSSNYKPDELYPNGLMRERFLPAIQLIKEKLQVIALESSQDYRLIHSSFNQMFFIKCKDSTRQLEEIFTKVCRNNSYQENGQIIIQSRIINFIKKSQNIIWLEFNLICGEQRSQLDYLELTEKFNWFIIDQIPPLSPADKDFARRFTWLIDILYDKQCKLALASAVAIDQIYPTGDFAAEFTRTISRLREMQTKEYLAQQANSSIASTQRI
ncbi:MAG: cell division protein ZapE [Burkholderiales bacterium]